MHAGSRYRMGLVALTFILTACGTSVEPPPSADGDMVPTPTITAQVAPVLTVEPNPVPMGSNATVVLQVGSVALERGSRYGLWRWDEASNEWVSLIPEDTMWTLGLELLPPHSEKRQTLHTNEFEPGRYRVEWYFSNWPALSTEFSVVAA